jgi:hypothetical protein
VGVGTGDGVGVGVGVGAGDGVGSGTGAGFAGGAGSGVGDGVPLVVWLPPVFVGAVGLLPHPTTNMDRQVTSKSLSISSLRTLHLRVAIVHLPCPAHLSIASLTFIVS